MTDAEITKAKFQACLHSSMTKFGEFELYDKKRLKEYDHAVFSKILIKSDLEEYNALLFNYFSDAIQTNELNSPGYHFHMDKASDDFRLELLKTYQFLQLREKEITASITINKSQNHTLANEQLIFEIENLIDHLFKNYFKGKDSSLENIELLILEYSLRHPPREGAKPKNQHLTILASEIGDLIKINRFINSETALDIDQIKLVPKDRKFIYECLSFWGFIDPKNISPPNNYIRTIIDQGAKFFPADYYNNRRTRLAELKAKLAQ